jgi:hypothetical protein
LWLVESINVAWKNPFDPVSENLPMNQLGEFSSILLPHEADGILVFSMGFL